MNTQKAMSIDAKGVSIGDLLEGFFAVPDFQREYVWQSDEVGSLLEDLYDAFGDKPQGGKSYFLGSIVVCKDQPPVMQLIDGQQRMTTLFLILCVARHLLFELEGKQNPVLDGQLSNHYFEPESGRPVRTHRLILQYEDSMNVLAQVIESDTPIGRGTTESKSVKNILDAYDQIRDWMKENMSNDVSKIHKFLADMTWYVTIVRIVTPDINSALRVFETINDRGIGLDAMDLLKNLLFMEVTKNNYEALKDKWAQLVEVLNNYREKPLRFLRYYIMSSYGNELPEDTITENEIYDWFKGHKNLVGISNNPIKFTDDLLKCAQSYVNFLDAKGSNGDKVRYLDNLLKLGGKMRQQQILLLAGRHLERDAFEELCRVLENVFFCYIIVRESTNMYERRFTRWASDLRSCKTKSDVDKFIMEHINRDLRPRVNDFNNNFKVLNQDKVQQYRMKYILAKFTQFIELNAWSKSADEDLAGFMDSANNIEHILSRNVSDMERNQFDNPNEYDDYVKRLGNLTLLEGTINKSLLNKPFKDKKEGYLKSNFLLTKSIMEKQKMGDNTQFNRAVADLKRFECWGASDIEERQEMLTRLAHCVWDMPSSS